MTQNVKPRLRDLSHQGRQIDLVQPTLQGKWIIDCFGGRTRRSFLDISKEDMEKHSCASLLEAFAPSYNEDFFDFAELVASILDCEDDFTLVELGSGFGRWLVHGANCCRMLGQPIGALVGIEAEPTHFRWMRQHFLDNSIDPNSHYLFEGVVSDKYGKVPFYTGSPSQWYGQSIAQSVIEFGPPKRPLLHTLANFFGRERLMDAFQLIPSYPLDYLLEIPFLVDFMHVDIQGSEFDVLNPAIFHLNHKVRRIHVATHGPTTAPARGRDMDRLIFDLFSSNGWKLDTRIAPGESMNIDNQNIHFVDGLQFWLNPQLKSKNA
jgi:hypothetical protein